MYNVRGASAHGCTRSISAASLDMACPGAALLLHFVFVTFCFIVALFVMVYRLRTSRLTALPIYEKIIPSKV